MDDLIRFLQEQNKLKYQRTQKHKKQASPPPLLRIGEYHPETGRYKVIFPNGGQVIGGIKLFNTDVPSGTPIRATRAYGSQSIGLDYRNYQPIPKFTEAPFIEITEATDIQNQPPIARNDTISTNQDTSVTINVLVNDEDIDGSLDISSIQIISLPSNGIAVAGLTGQITYIPNTGFNGIDSFTYIVRDSLGEISNSAIVTITVSPDNPICTLSYTIYLWNSEDYLNDEDNYRQNLIEDRKIINIPCNSTIALKKRTRPEFFEEEYSSVIEKYGGFFPNFDPNGFTISWIVNGQQRTADCFGWMIRDRYGFIEGNYEIIDQELLILDKCFVPIRNEFDPRNPTIQESSGLLDISPCLFLYDYALYIIEVRNGGNLILQDFSHAVITYSFG